MDKPIPESVVEAVARAICVACEENPDHRGDARGNEFRWQDYRDTALAAINTLTAAQQQGQAVDLAPPSAPVGVEAIAAEIRASLGRGATVCTRRRWAIELEALAQQPAAVDGDNPYPAPRNRQEAAALAKLALAYLGVTGAHIDAAVARCETDLAAQQGGES